jgi:hypothetical protein
VRYRQKPGLYEALQFDGRNHEQVATFAGDSVITGIAPGASCAERSILVKCGDLYTSPDPGWWVLREVTADGARAGEGTELFGAGSHRRLFRIREDGLSDADTSLTAEMVQYTGDNDAEITALFGEGNTGRDGARFLVRYSDGKWGVMQPGWRAGVLDGGARMVLSEHSFERWVPAG